MPQGKTCMGYGSATVSCDNYFSGVFSQEMGQTFVEYLTEKRMAMGHKADDHEEQVSYQQTM